MSDIGTFAILARKPETIDKNHSTYYDGEYIIVSESPNAVIGFKVACGGHDTGETRSFLRREYDVLDAQRDDAALLRLIEDIEHFAQAVDRGEKLNWVGYVYERARYAARRLRAIYLTLDSPQVVDWWSEGIAHLRVLHHAAGSVRVCDASDSNDLGRVYSDAGRWLRERDRVLDTGGSAASKEVRSCGS